MATINVNVDDNTYAKLQAVSEKLHMAPEKILEYTSKGIATVGGAILIVQKKKQDLAENPVEDDVNSPKPNVFGEIIRDTISDFLKDKGIDVEPDDISISHLFGSFKKDKKDRKDKRKAKKASKTDNITVE